MPSIKNNSINDYDIENDCEEEQYENEFENGQNLIKCGEILLFKYNLFISCNYCEETLNNFEIFTNHLIEKHLNNELNQVNVNNDNEMKLNLDENVVEDNNAILNANELEEIENYKYIANIPNSSNLCYFNEIEDNVKSELMEEINDNKLNLKEETEIVDIISNEIQPIQNNVIKDTQTMFNRKPTEVQNKFMPMMGNRFKKNSETYEEKFYKYCKLFKEKEANAGRDHFHDRLKNKTTNRINSNQQIPQIITEIPNNIELEPNNVIFDDNLIDDLIEEDVTAISFIENPNENIDFIEETVSFAEDNPGNIIDQIVSNQEDNFINEHIEIKHQDNFIETDIKILLENNEIKTENLIDKENSLKIEEDIKQTTINSYRNSKKLTAISTKLNNFYHCPDCPRYYTRFETLKIHYRSHTGEKNPHKCLICQKTFSAPCKLVQHERVHTGERPYKCTLCPQAFKAKQKLKNHLESHEKGTIKRPTIYVDGMSTLERQPACLPILINNKFITSSEAKKVDGLYHCPVCERKYRRFESLKEHADIHVEMKQYECHICNKRFTKIRTLRVHLKSHTPNKNIRWNGVPISCDYCEKTFNNKYYLNEHLTVHSGKRPYECNTCNKKFAFKSNFILHERTHSGDKRYQCRYCDMKFIQSTTKVRHERVVHLKQPPFTCRYCQQSFYTFSLYKKHINDHKINDELLTSSKELYDENGENIITNDNVEQTIIVDNNEEHIIVVEPEDIKVNDFICSLCGAYFVDCGQYIEHCKSHDNNINEQNIVHYMEDDIVGSEEIIV